MGASTPHADPSIRLDSITRTFGDRSVLHSFSWERNTAGVIGFTGPNGCGKTTLVRLIAQLVEADAGSISVCGHLVGDGAASDMARRCIGYVPHRPLARSMRSVRANLMHAASLRSMPRQRRLHEVDRVLDAWNARTLEHQALSELSRGQQQRYALAMADIDSPPVLLLDEPTVGLDGAGRADLEHALEAWRSERVVLVTSHEHEWLSGIADEIIDLGEAGTHA